MKKGCFCALANHEGHLMVKSKKKHQRQNAVVEFSTSADKCTAFFLKEEIIKFLTLKGVDT